MITGGGGGGGAAFAQGTLAARPSSPAANALYFATDSAEWFIGNAAGNAWQSIGKTSGLAGVLKVGANASLDGTGETLTLAPSYAFFTSGSGISANQPLEIANVGNGLLVKEGANGKQGTYGPLVAGTLAVANTSITASSRILVCRAAGGTNGGAHYVSAQTAGTGFTVTSTNAADTGGGVFFILEPGG